MTKHLYSVSEAIQLLSLGRTRLYEEINQGRIAAKKIGRRTVIPASAIDAWIKNLPPIHQPRD